MREIKFRAWDKRHKSMEQMQDLYWFEENFVRQAHEAASMTGDWVIMQYTGLLDRNGVEIYEGDIFNCMYHGDGHADHVYTVEYYEQGTKFLLRRYGNKCPQNGVVQTVSDVARYEVIGNIYEHSHLLEANQ